METTTPDNPDYIPLPHYEHSTWWGRIRFDALGRLDDAGLSRFDYELRHGGKWNLDAHFQVLNALVTTAARLSEAAPGMDDAQRKIARGLAAWMLETEALNRARSQRQSDEIRRAMTGPVDATWKQVD